MSTTSSRGASGSHRRDSRVVTDAVRGAIVGRRSRRRGEVKSSPGLSRRVSLNELIQRGRGYAGKQIQKQCVLAEPGGAVRWAIAGKQLDWLGDAGVARQPRLTALVPAERRNTL